MIVHARVCCGRSAGRERRRTDGPREAAGVRGDGLPDRALVQAGRASAPGSPGAGTRPGDGEPLPARLAPPTRQPSRAARPPPIVGPRAVVALVAALSGADGARA